MSAVYIPYARALYRASGDRTERWLSLLEDFNKALKLKSVSSYFSDPIIAKSKKIELLEGLLGNAGFDQELLRFLGCLLINNRLSFLSEIIEMVRTTYNKAKGIKSIKIVQAAELPESSKANLLKWLSKKIPGKLNPVWLVDSGILGGVVIYDGDTVYDYSLRVKVEQIKKIILGK